MTESDTDYRLIYWPIPGRGEFVRLCLAHGDARWVDTPGGVEEVLSYIEGEATLPRDQPQPLAPPILRDEKNGVLISQTPAILAYLAPKLGLDGENESAKFHVLQLALTGLDFNSEIHNTHHPIAVSLAYEDQKEESKRYSEFFRNERIPKFLNHLDTTLERNTASKQTYVVGNKVTYADYVWWQVLDGLLFAFPKRTRNVMNTCKHLNDFYQHIRTQPRIEAYLKSDRRLPYSSGVYRYYSELDSD